MIVSLCGDPHLLVASSCAVCRKLGKAGLSFAADQTTLNGTISALSVSGRSIRPGTLTAVHAAETSVMPCPGLTRFIIGSKFFNSLPPDYQKALVEECRAAGQATSRKVLAAEAEQQKALEQRGMTVVGDVDSAAFRAAGDKAYDALGLTDEKNAVLKEIGKAQ